MKKLTVITDSNSGITPAVADRLGIRVLPMPFYINDQLFYEGIDLNADEFFEKQRADMDIKTSQPSPDDVTNLWDEVLQSSDEIVYIPMSSGLSGSCQTATMLAAEYNGRVQVVNNQRISVTQRASVLDALALAGKGYSALRIREILERERLESSIYIMVDTLKYLKKGGRLTPAAAALGTLLRLKPVLQIQGEKLDSFAKARTLVSAKNIMIEAMASDLEKRFGGADAKNVTLAIAHTDSREQAEVFRDEIRTRLPQYLYDQIVICPLSLSVSCHIGPGALAIACSRKIPELS